MRSILWQTSLAGAAFSLAILAASFTGTGAQAGADADRHMALASQNNAGFGYAIDFADGGYTPPGIISRVRVPLASQDRAGFGDAIHFTASSYTPPGIARATIDVVVR